MIRIIGIRRGNRYSPNHIGNDAAIFNLVVEHLTKSGYEVAEYSEQEFLESSSFDVEIIFNMARDKKSIKKLQRLEDEGKLVLNSGYGIENCTREKIKSSTDYTCPIEWEFGEWNKQRQAKK